MRHRDWVRAAPLLNHPAVIPLPYPGLPDGVKPAGRTASCGLVRDGTGNRVYPTDRVFATGRSCGVLDCVPGEQIDPVEGFRAQLQKLFGQVRRPTYRTLQTHATDEGRTLPTSTLSALLNGPAIPRWE